MGPCTLLPPAGQTYLDGNLYLRVDTFNSVLRAPGQASLGARHGWSGQIRCCGCSVAQSCPTLQPLGLQHARLTCPSPSPRVCPSSCPLSQWCHPTISSSVIPFSCLQSFPSWRSFPVSGQTQNAATPRGLNLGVQRTTLGNLQTSVKSVETPFPSTAVCGMWTSHLISLSLNFSVYKMGL